MRLVFSFVSPFMSFCIFLIRFCLLQNKLFNLFAKS
nr:MAG TPA: hypothetical protein [Caudoviricetes sp.]